LIVTPIILSHPSFVNSENKNSPPEPDQAGGECLPEYRLSPVLQKPLVELRVVVGLGPGIMPNAGVNGEPHVAAAGPQGVHHPLAHFELDNVVFCTVKGPDRDVLELTGEFRETTATGDVDVHFFSDAVFEFLNRSSET
jgi:hypothetical protein